ncbi:hypothetical protein [Allorhizocola rhizosphaerae]|uniref:hypothetical protein n=1 Tax=Allorhizocola rhizosphaerae TaxID=1872709 RepID=UPI000E3BB23A|nr:hypothetical protein [Allorhizocola rhizosphaerae]
MRRLVLSIFSATVMFVGFVAVAATPAEAVTIEDPAGICTLEFDESSGELGIDCRVNQNVGGIGHVRFHCGGSTFDLSGPGPVEVLSGQCRVTLLTAAGEAGEDCQGTIFAVDDDDIIVGQGSCSVRLRIGDAVFDVTCDAHPVASIDTSGSVPGIDVADPIKLCSVTPV